MLYVKRRKICHPLICLKDIKKSVPKTFPDSVSLSKKSKQNDDEPEKNFIKRRNRVFTPIVFFCSIIKLVSTDSLDGIQILLDDLFSNDLGVVPPSDSALSQFRNTVSYNFFKDIFINAVNSLRNYIPKYKGFRFFGLDGDQYHLPRSKDVLNNNYNGYPLSDGKETYSPVMYTVTATELMTGAPVDFYYSITNNEILGALEMVKKSNKKDVFVYDRFYYSKELVDAHTKAGNYFIIRLRRGGVPNEFMDFFISDKPESTVFINNQKLRIVNAGFDSDGGPIFLLTNLPKSIFSWQQIGILYNRRWRSETGNRETTSSLSLDHFHGRDLNKILQEIYACLWLKFSSAVLTTSEISYETFFTEKEYKMPNMKEVLRLFQSKLLDILNNKNILFCVDMFKKIIRRSTEKRRHNSRSYPKEVSYKRKKTFPTKIVERNS